MRIRTLTLCAALLPCPTGAQNAPATGPSIVLPQKLIAGQPATLAVIGPDGRLVENATVEFSGGARVTTSPTGRATFLAPAQAGVLLAKLAEGRATSSSTIITSPVNPPDGVVVDEVPHVIALHDRFSVNGYGFRGEADANLALLGHQPVPVLAASPVELVLLPDPHAAPGPTQLEIQVGGRSQGPVPVTLVTLEISSDKARLRPNERGTLTVRVRGSWQRLELEARNLTPEIVELPQGDLLRLLTSGGGDNSARIQMKGRRAGDFSVSVRLVPGAAGLPDTQLAFQKLLAARRLAPPGWGPRLDPLIHKMDRHPQDAHHVRSELERLLAEQPGGEFGKLLEAAWQALQKK